MAGKAPEKARAACFAHPRLRSGQGDARLPANYSTAGYRLLWTLCGVAIGVAVMFLAGLPAKRRTATVPPQPA